MSDFEIFLELILTFKGTCSIMALTNGGITMELVSNKKLRSELYHLGVNKDIVRLVQNFDQDTLNSISRKIEREKDISILSYKVLLKLAKVVTRGNSIIDQNDSVDKYCAVLNIPDGVKHLSTVDYLIVKIISRLSEDLEEFAVKVKGLAEATTLDPERPELKYIANLIIESAVKNNCKDLVEVK